MPSSPRPLGASDFARRGLVVELCEIHCTPGARHRGDA
jgi:hypothetical protein